MPELQFIHLNKGWNAHPNAPSVDVHFHGKMAELRFLLNPFMFEAEPGEVAALRFGNCSRWHWGHTNDHAWYSGSGRYSKQAPKWGEFYEVVGEEILGGDADWEIISTDPANARHFLFYFRDEALEFIASDWSIYRNRLILQ